MKKLIAYLRDNVILDFQGDLSLEMVRELLKDDDSRESKQLLAKLVEERGVNDLLITLADCLADEVRTNLSDDAVRAQLRTYSES